MNERHWRTPKAVISDPPPTTQHRQKDNKRKKPPKYVTSQASKQGHTVRDESCVSCYPHSSFFYFDLSAEIWGGEEKTTRPTKRLSLQPHGCSHPVCMITIITQSIWILFLILYQMIMLPFSIHKHYINKPSQILFFHSKDEPLPNKQEHMKYQCQ